ncbi:serine protease 27-like [Emys orbicularis]|uniref:serine protease 27-like n=1 Tax=Emys orbicularis TaxID=82168 RepID=UPI0031FCD308
MEAAGFGQDRTRRGWTLGHLCSLLAMALLASSLVQGAQGSQNQAGCGKQLVSGRILNGQAAKDGAWPWQVSVQQNGSYICGGSLISESWVVSAAQCFTPSVDSSAYRVQLGEKRIFDQTRNQTYSLVKRVVLHPSYDSNTYQADIALLELEKPTVFTATISPVCLLDASVRAPAGKPCWVTGWGNLFPQTGISRPSTLHEVEVLAVDSMSCNSRFREALKKPESYSPIKDDMMCAGYTEGHKGFAWGDFGGPLVCEKDGTWYLAGIVSWFLTTTTNAVASGYPGVYNRPNAHNDWIQKNVPGVTFKVVNLTTTDTLNGASLSATIPRVSLLVVLLRLVI